MGKGSGCRQWRSGSLPAVASFFADVRPAPFKDDRSAEEIAAVWRSSIMM
jgi:hypothetical protein